MLDLPAKSNGETIRQHTDKLLESFKNFIDLYGEYFSDNELKAIEIACEYHDYGKTIFSFQKQIKNNDFISDMKKRGIYNDIVKMYDEIGFSDEVLPHGYISPAFIDMDKLKAEFDMDMIRNIITAIYYHHNRKAEIASAGIKRVIKEDLQKRYDIDISEKFKGKVAGKNYFINDEEEKNDTRWINYAVIIGMLNKFDYHASCEDTDKPDAEISSCDSEGKYISDRVNDFFNANNYIYRDIQRYAANHKNDNIIVIASTGIGKTEAALLWADKGKIFYTLPLKVSINAMYRRIIDIYKYPHDKATLLHSDAFSYLCDGEYDNNVKIKYEASRRFSYPLTVCTVDQLFTFVYKYRGCEQVFAALKYSKLIIDEIQAYEPELIAKIIYGLKLITMAGGKFAIITATFPPVLEYFLTNGKYFNDGLPIEFEKPQSFLITDKLRHKIHYSKSDEFDYDFILEKSSCKKVLIICNTVKRACEVYRTLKEQCNDTWLIHSNFIRSDRHKLENAVMDFSNDKSSCGIWISTQIVEASLDIDFDILFTEMSTADSLLQRMGRCYRKRDYKADMVNDEPNVYIIDNHNGYGKVYKYTEIYDRSAEFIMKYQDSFFSENDKMQYINDVYNTDEIKNTKYFRDIEETMKQLRRLAPFVFESDDAKRKFRNITSYTVIPKSIYDRYTEDFDECIRILTDKSDKKLSPSERFMKKQNSRKFIEDNSLQISNFDVRSKNISKSIFNGLDYYTADYKYMFSEDDDTYNLGLTYDFDEDCNFC